MNLTLNCCSVPIISFSIQVVRKAKSKKSLIFQKSQRLLLPSPSCLYVYYMSRTLKFQVNSSYSFILCLPMLCNILSYQLCLNFSFSGAPHNEDSLCLLQSKEENKFVLDLLGLHSIHYRIQSRRDGHVEVGKLNEHISRYPVPKAMGEDGEGGRYVKHEDDTDVGTTCAEGLLAGPLG